MLKKQIDSTRNWLGRAGTVAGAAALAASLGSPHALVLAVPATIGAAGLGAAVSIRPWRENVPGALTALYVAPSVLLLGEMAVFQMFDGANLGECLAAAIWAAGTWWVRPARLAVSLVKPAASDGDAKAGLAPVRLAVPGNPAERLTAFWAQAVAIEGSVAPGTRLERCEVTGPCDFRAEIVAPPGVPVPDISVTKLSALFNIPPELISVGPVPGSGTGRKQLTVSSGQAAGVTTADIYALWATHVAPQAMPGSVVTAIRHGSTKTGPSA